LIDAGIALSEAQDELRWTGGDCTGILSTRNVYNALAAELWQNINGGMRGDYGPGIAHKRLNYFCGSL
jgi:hypothetical protein